MADCAAILKNGVFDTVITDTTKTAEESLYQWLKETDTGTIQDTQKSGLQFGLPIEGLPLQIKASHTDQEIETWKKAVDSGQSRYFTETEITQIVESSASPIIAKAWLDCIKATQFGLVHYMDGDGATLAFFARWSPNSPEDSSPTITGFEVVGATAKNPPAIGTEITYGGLLILLTRTEQTSGPNLYPEVTVVLNTTKSAALEIEPAVLKPPTVPQTPPISVKVFKGFGPPAPHPEAKATVSQGYKVISGGARVNWQGGSGNLLTASYPEDSRTWVARAKDHINPSPASIDVWALGLYDPNDEWEVEMFRKDSTPAQHPEVMVTVDPSYVMTGGGAFAHWSTQGSLLTASRPVGRDTWHARSKDHERAEVVTLTAYAIGIRPRNRAQKPELRVIETTSDPAQHPSAVARSETGTQLVGGGASVAWEGAGNLLTASCPEGSDRWAASSKDHIRVSPARITAYALGLRRVQTTAQAVMLRVGPRTTPNQEGWRWCKKCQGLSFAGTGLRRFGSCPAGGQHDYTGSGRYLLVHDMPYPYGQSNWRWCRKCQGVTFAGSATLGACAGGGQHDHTGSWNYHLAATVPGGQRNWRWCRKCQGLTSVKPRLPGARADLGPCPAGGQHDHTGSGEYMLVHSR